jgi:DNA-binding transcriptional LysR family regulator
MDLNHLAVFVRVVEAQSFTAAARALGLPKSTVSRRVSQLEEAIGVRLLQRTTRKLSLTDAGHAYFQHASHALAEIEEATSAISDMQGTPRGAVRMTAPVDLGVEVVSDLVTRFVRKHPGIHVDLALTNRTVDMVAEGFDIALRAGRLIDSTLIARRLGSMSIQLFATPGYLKRRGTPRTVADLASHECVLFRGKAGKAEWTLVGPRGTETVTVSGPISVDDFGFVRRAVLGGVGIGLVPWFLCALERDRGKLVRVLPDHATPGGALHLVYPSARHLPQRVAVFRDFVLAELAKLPWDG